MSGGNDGYHRGDHVRIGYAECVDLPDFGVQGLRVKADTGARTSALHVEDIERLSGNRIRFDVVLNRQTDRRAHVVTKLSRVGEVRSSSGKQERRYFVKTRIRIGHVEKEIEVSLASRSTMQFRMLLGRTALAQDFVVDPGRRYLQGKRPPRRIPKSTKKKRAPRKSSQRSKHGHRS